MLRQLHATLKPRGVLFSSNPRGDNDEGWNGGRYGAYHDLDAWSRYLEEAGLCAAGALLPADGSATRSAAVARQRLAPKSSHALGTNPRK